MRYFPLALAPAAVGLPALLAFAAGCTPHIGDGCALNTDCSLDGTKVCDNSQPYGYCTTFSCLPNTCQDYAACVELYASVPGCLYDGYQSPSRASRTLCLKQCQQDSDCRNNEGYVCRDPRHAPLYGVVLDDNVNVKVCMQLPAYAAGSPAGDAESPVCLPAGPTVPPIEAGLPDAPQGG